MRLAQRDVDGPLADDVLLHQLSSKLECQREAALRRIAKDKELVRLNPDKVAVLLQDSSGLVRAAAVSALVPVTTMRYDANFLPLPGGRQISEFGMAVVPLLEDEHYLVRIEALRSVGTYPEVLITPKEEAMIVAILMDDRSPAVRREAVAALGAAPTLLYKYRDILERMMPG